MMAVHTTVSVWMVSLGAIDVLKSKYYEKILKIYYHNSPKMECHRSTMQ